jgi:hypothetical protein
MRYLKEFVDKAADESSSIKIVPTAALQDSGKWERYSLGTQGPCAPVLKFEDDCADPSATIIYRAELVCPHPEERSFYVDVMSARKSRKSGTGTITTRKLGPFDDYDAALVTLAQQGNIILKQIHDNARKAHPYFEITPGNDSPFRYATIVLDSAGTPVTIISLEEPFRPDGSQMPARESYHSVHLYNGSNRPFVLKEGEHFEAGRHPRSFMPELKEAIHSMRYSAGPEFIEEARHLGVPLKL